MLNQIWTNMLCKFHGIWAGLTYCTFSVSILFETHSILMHTKANSLGSDSSPVHLKGKYNTVVSLIKALWQALSCILPCLSLFEKQSHKKCNDLFLRLQNTVYFVWDCNKSVEWNGWKEVCRLARGRQSSLDEPS